VSEEPILRLISRCMGGRQRSKWFEMGGFLEWIRT
jgi:hypothetical protein